MASENDTPDTLPPRAAGPRGSASSPQAGSLHLEFPAAVRTVDLESGMTIEIDTLIKVLQVSEIRRIQVLDCVGIDVVQTTEASNHPSEQDDDEITGVCADSWILDRLDFV